MKQLVWMLLCAFATPSRALVAKVGHLSLEVEEKVVEDALFNVTLTELYQTVLKNTDIQLEIITKGGCWPLTASRGAYQLYTEDKIDALLGPACSQGIAAFGPLAAYWNLTILGFLSTGEFLADKTTYPTLARVSVTVDEHVEALAAFMLKMKWRRIAIVYLEQAGRWPLMLMQGLENKLTEMGTSFALKVNLHVNPYENEEIQTILARIKTYARVIVIQNYTDGGLVDVRQFLLEAHKANMTGPDYVWIVPWLNRQTEPLPWKMGDEYDQLAKDIWKNVLVLMPGAWALNIYDKLQQRIEQFLGRRVVLQQSIWMSAKHDALYLYATAVRECISMPNCTWQNGHDLFQLFRNKIFFGATGRVIMSDTADRYADFHIATASDDGEIKIWYDISVEQQTKGDQTVVYRKVTEKAKYDWRTADSGPPPDVPECGLDGMGCPTVEPPTDNTSNVVIIVLILAAASVIGVVFWFKYNQFQNALLRTVWHVNSDDLHFPNAFHSTGMSLLSIKSQFSHGRKSMMTIESYDYSIGMYKGQKVIIKAMEAIGDVKINERSDMLLLKDMRTLQHSNINPFIGLCIKEDRLNFIYSYCQRGLLEDVIHNDEISLDMTFKSSIINDVFQGLQFIHRSRLGYHGQLTTFSCWADSRWVVKISDAGMIEMQISLLDGDLVHYKSEQAAKLLQLAPEVLRNLSPEGFSSRPTPEADVYSFGIIMYQVLFQKKPFDNAGVATDEDTLQEIMYPRSVIIRPIMQRSTFKPQLLAAIKHCWAEEPIERPTLAYLREILSLIASEFDNLFDHMMRMMEKYANNLEKMVESRTEELLQERQRADLLLNRMLPKTIADKLKNGLSVEPELFKSATLLFTDIVGFTNLCSQLSAGQVVTMMNQLYSVIDALIEKRDAYKVETVGDSYLVASGLPVRNGTKHVFEIADLALEFRMALSSFRLPHMPEKHLSMRFGIHSGAVAAGVVGLVMPHYCLFGDTVNTASRMESTSQPMNIHVTDDVKVLIEQSKPGIYELIQRGFLEIKGKGQMMTHWLMGKFAEGDKKDFINNCM